MNESLSMLENYNIALLAKGDVKAFDTLFMMYSKKLYHFAFGYLKAKEEAEEIVQETFVKIWEKKAELNPENSLSGLLFTIAHRLILNRLRKLQHEKKYESYRQREAVAWSNVTEETIYAKEMEAMTRSAIEALPPKRQMIFRMVRIENMTHQQVADQLQISVKTVEAQMTEALKFLRNRIVIQSIIPFAALFLGNP